MTQINAYLGFNGKCREAMNFYKEILGGELTMQTVAETPVASQCPKEVQNDIMHASLAKGPLLLMATDMVGPGGFKQGNNVALALSCSSEEEINAFFSKLAEGGQVLDSLKTQFWGGIFGTVEDKFGVRWMLNYEKNQS